VMATVVVGMTLAAISAYAREDRVDPGLTGSAIEGSTAIGRLPSTAIEPPWYCRPQLPQALASPIEAWCKADGLHFVLNLRSLLLTCSHIS
jgi:hypothetical protein